jgi:hypothetical protein
VVPEKTLRFAVGSPWAPFSAVWRLVGGKDPFLGCYRQGMGLFKISIHPDDTLFGFTAQSGVKFEHGSRIDKAWPRPPEFHPGWTLGPSILVPRTSIGARALREDLHPTTSWVRAPREGEAVFFRVVLEAPGGAPDGAIMEPGQVALGSVKERRSGGEVWVIAGRRPLTPEFRSTCEGILADPANRMELVGAPNPDRPPGSLLWVNRDDVQPRIVDLPAPILGSNR